MTIHRFSSRRAKLGPVLTSALVGAQKYDRIAGYFSSSILEVAGEAIESMAAGACVRVICNSGLEPLDVITAKAAKRAMYREWCDWLPADFDARLKARMKRLYELLSSGRLQVRVLPDERFGLIHGKAGVVTRADGSQVAFLGSANETKSGWLLSYELVWTDDSAEGVAWVQEEFDALWAAPEAVDLADAVIRDVERLAERTVIVDLPAWREEAGTDPAAPIVELPVYRRDNGLWAHQKSFIKLAFTDHQRTGARYLLADQVGLGKTVQLALSAKLMNLWGGGPILILAPKPLMQQWQDEMWRLLQMPSARWNGRAWVDEAGIEHPDRGPAGLAKCPRRVGIVSTGIVTHSREPGRILASMNYECVVLDEAHRARRRNLGPSRANEKADPNNLLRFLYQISSRTRSMLLATATPVQLDPIEAWDLLDALGQPDDRVLGSIYSAWRQQARTGLDLVTGRSGPPISVDESWQWIRDPLPPSDEDRDFALLRQALKISADHAWVVSNAIDDLRPPDRERLRHIASEFFRSHHPYIRRIVRRSREYLETTLDPETHEPYIPPIEVKLFGERPDESVQLPAYLRDAYEAAEAFCREVGSRPGFNSGFLKTILLRRVGSSVRAGQLTAEKMLGPSHVELDEEDEDPEEDSAPVSALYPLRPAEIAELGRFLALLQANRDEDPKVEAVDRLLRYGHAGTGPWLDIGCIVFSQYLDSVAWLARVLSERMAAEPIAVYANATSSGIWEGGAFRRLNREVVRDEVVQGRIRLLIGTDAASEGLNLQRLGSLINLDLPWNPTRLEQRKGRIQRLGQPRPEVLIYNMRYRESVEDRVHELLSERLKTIRNLFGQVPDTLEDVWVQVALRDEEKAWQIIDTVPSAHPFEMRYDRVESVDFETCRRVLDSEAQLEALRRGW